MKHLKQRSLFLYAVLTTLLAFAQSSTPKVAYLQLPGGAVFKNPKKLVIPAGKNWVLPQDVYIRIDRIEIMGTIYTRGHLLSIYAGKMIFGPEGAIKTFDTPAPASLITLPTPGAPHPSPDQGKDCHDGIVGAEGNRGSNAPADPLTNGLKNPQPIKIFAAELEGIAKIEAFGQTGGKGTKGGAGSQGGQGGRGGKADADRGPLGIGGDTCDGGNGGNGGKGGQGGNGGVGGTGGPAPQVEFIVANVRTQQELSANITLREGAGGEGGEVGDGGPGGTGGAGGNGDSAAVLGESLWGNSKGGGTAGQRGPTGNAGDAKGAAGASGPIPLENDRALDVLQTLESFRRAVFAQWQEFHWHRHLLAHVQDSFRLIETQLYTREQMESKLSEDADLFAQHEKRQLRRIVDAWQKAFIQPLEETLDHNPENYRIRLGLKMAKRVVSLLEQIDRDQDLQGAQKSVSEVLYGENGILALNRSQITKATGLCADYNRVRTQTKFKSDHMGLYFRIPSCEGEPDFTKIENLNADIILADNVENDFQPKFIEDELKKSASPEKPYISKLRLTLLREAWAEASEHPLGAIKLIPFSIPTVRLGTTSERDEASLGLIQRLKMKNEEEIWANNFYQELRAFAVMTGERP